MGLGLFIAQPDLKTRLKESYSPPLPVVKECQKKERRSPKGLPGPQTTACSVSEVSPPVLGRNSGFYPVT